MASGWPGTMPTGPVLATAHHPLISGPFTGCCMILFCKSQKGAQEYSGKLFRGKQRLKMLY